MKDVVLERVMKILNEYPNVRNIENFAKQMGINPMTLRKQINGERAISLDTILAITSTYGDISTEWLLRGEGDMIKTNASSNINNFEISTGNNNTHIVGNNNNNSPVTASTIEHLMAMQQQLIDYVTGNNKRSNEQGH